MELEDISFLLTKLVFKIKASTPSGLALLYKARRSFQSDRQAVGTDHDLCEMYVSVVSHNAYYIVLAYETAQGLPENDKYKSNA